jgi:hypothetical protein
MRSLAAFACRSKSDGDGDDECFVYIEMMFFIIIISLSSVLRRHHHDGNYSLAL